MNIASARPALLSAHHNAVHSTVRCHSCACKLRMHWGALTCSTLQIEAAEVFAYIAKERLMSPADLQACLLPTVVRNINKERSEEVRSWQAPVP